MGNLIFTHGGNIYEIKRIFNKEVIDFSANINPLGLPPQVKKIIYDNFESVLHYPDSKATDITKKIAKYWGINQENILLGNGSVELIYLITSCFRPKTALIIVPAFSEYERATRNIKSRIKFLNLYEKENFRLNPSRLTNSDILFLSNPNNPTGNLILTDPAITEKSPNKIIVVDEAFMDFVPEERKYTLIGKATKSIKIIVLRTFTKFFALPGLRIGYLVAHKDIVKTLRQHHIPWNINTLAQLSASEALVDKRYQDKTLFFMKKERIFLFSQIEKIKGLHPYPSEANFILIRIDNKRLTSSLLTKKLIRRGILVRDCANFRGLNNKYVRVAVRSRADNLNLLAAFRQII